jgi:hypothetical protein
MFLEKIRKMELTDYPFKICLQQEGGRPGIWVDWNDWDWDERPFAQFRSLCQNELCLDMDIDDPLTLYMTSKLLQDRLKDQNIPHYIWDSGGKGYHFQIWLDAPPTSDWRAVRSNIVRYLTEGILNRTKVGGVWHWNIDPRKYNWDSRGQGSIVRAEGGRKKWVKWLVQDILPPNKRQRKSRPTFPAQDFVFEVWKVPEKLIKIQREMPKPEVVFKDESLPICIELLIEEETKGVHLRHTQRVALVAHCWKVWKAKHPKELMTDKDIQEIHKIFTADPAYDSNRTDYQVRNVINSLEQDPWKVPGCRYMRNEGIIDDELCSICKAIGGKK